MGTEPSAGIDVSALSQVLGASGGWFVAILLLFGGGGGFIWLMAKDKLVTGRRLEQLQKAYEREQARGDTLATTLLKLQPGVQLAVHSVERLTSLTIDGEPPSGRQGITP